MGRPRGWVTERTGRAPMRSAGRPGVNQRDAKQAFWARIAAGASSEDAGLASGVSQPVGTRWFREAGGMAPISMVALSGRFLSFGEREELALLHAQRLAVREIARRMERSPSTISRASRKSCYRCLHKPRNRLGYGLTRTLRALPFTRRSAKRHACKACASETGTEAAGTLEKSVMSPSAIVGWEKIRSRSAV